MARSLIRCAARFALRATACEHASRPNSSPRWVALLGLLLVLPATLQAELRSVELFSGEVLVATRSDDERRELAGQALENAYIRITGDVNVLET